MRMDVRLSTLADCATNFWPRFLFGFLSELFGFLSEFRARNSLRSVVGESQYPTNSALRYLHPPLDAMSRYKTLRLGHGMG